MNSSSSMHSPMNITLRFLLRALWPLLLAAQAVSVSAAAPAAADASAAPAPAVPATSAAAPPPAASPGDSTDAGAAAGTRALDEQIQGLKKDVVDLNKDLFVLEEELLFPANTQVAVFVSMDVGDFFALDSVTLKIDNHDVSNYLYTPREVTALLKGGVQRLYVGNLKAGEHELVAFFNGKGPHDRDYRRAANISFRKGRGRQVSGTQDHRSPARAAARVRDQGLGIGRA